MPLRLRHGYAAGIHRGLPIGNIDQPRSSPHFARIRTATQPISVRFGAGGSLLRGVHTLIHCRYTFPLCSPGAKSSDSADPPRLCQGCLPPSPVSPGSGCPQLLLARCDEPTAVSFHHGTVQGASWRSMSQLQTCSGRWAMRWGLVLAGWVRWRRRSRFSPASRRTRCIVDSEHK
jgi:hypothetical protein